MRDQAVTLLVAGGVLLLTLISPAAVLADDGACEEKALLAGYVAANLSLERQLLALLEAGDYEQAKALLQRSIAADETQQQNSAE